MVCNKLTPEIEKDICDMYSNNTIKSISLKYHINELRIRGVLVKHGIEIRNPRKAINKDGEWDYQTECKNRFPKHEGFHYVVVSKDGKAKYDDYMNTSGILTNYIQEHYGVKPDSLYKRKKFFKEHGYQWYEEYFDIIEEPVQKIEYKYCPYCNWKTTDITNRSGAFINHLFYEHDLTKEEYLKEHPDDLEYLSLAHPTKQLQFETNSDKFVTCAICGKKLKRIDQRHLKYHNITKEEYEYIYSGGTVSSDLHEKLSKATTEHNKHSIFHNRSKAEIEIEKFIEEHGVKINGKRKMVEGNEIDIYLPDLRVGIEYNGIFYHTEEMGKGKNYHLNKTEACKRNNIRLIQIFEDEYTQHKEIVLNKILHIIGCHANVPKIMARKCIINEIGINTAKNFLNEYHIQGFVSSSIYLGAYYNNNLIAVMSFKKEDNHTDKWELNRFASNYDYVCQGVGGKLFKYFIRHCNPSYIKSFADRRWTLDENNNLYTKLGFTFDKFTKPDYRYVDRGALSHVRVHKFNFRKSKLLAMDKNNILNPNMSEDEMRKKMGLKKCWDCGLVKYVWYKN